MVNARHTTSSSDDDRLTRRRPSGARVRAWWAWRHWHNCPAAVRGPRRERQRPTRRLLRAVPAAIPRPAEKLKLATCQFPVSGNPVENANYIRGFLRQAAEAGAHLLHTSEACLSGYAGIDFRSFTDYDWATLREVTTGLRELAKDLKLWLVLGSAHFLDPATKPTNCLYLIDRGPHPRPL